MKRTFFALVFGLLSSTSYATGGFECEVANKFFSMDVRAVTTHGAGAAVASLQGRSLIDVYENGEYFHDDIQITKSDLKQYWNSRSESIETLKLVIYKEGVIDGKFKELLIELTAEGRDGLLSGHAVFSYFKGGKVVEGRHTATCRFAD